MTTYHDITLDTPIKFLTSIGSGTCSRKARYPVNRKLTVKGPLELCENGYHWTTPRHWRSWVDAQCWLVEPIGETLTGNDKSCSRSIRLVRQLDTWNDRSARLLACEIAETVLHLTIDPRPAQAIEVARRFARGLATADELRTARAAAEAAAGAFARAAARAAWAAEWAAAEAAWAAAAVAEAAAGAAAEAAAETAWAARAAAGDAAGDAAAVAEAAARAFARAAAGDAAGDAEAAATAQHAEMFLATLRGERNQE